MRDVAALAGVSLKTVSRVVNREPGVSPSLTERVDRAAQQLGYRPNLGARSLRRSDGKTSTIGVVLENLANPFSASVLRAIEDVARAHDVGVLAGSIDAAAHRERELVAAFADRRVDGLIVMPSGEDWSHLSQQLALGTALVLVDRAPSHVLADAVVVDNLTAARDSVQHLIDAGHRRIAFLGDRRAILTAQQRFAGYSEAMGNAELAVLPELVVHDLTDSPAAEAATAALLALPAAPTALFAAQNLISIGALRALREAGAQHRVALVGFDDFALADLLDPPVTVMAQDPYEIGRLAAEQLFARLDGDTAPVRHQVVPTRLICRGSGEVTPGR